MPVIAYLSDHRADTLDRVVKRTKNSPPTTARRAPVSACRRQRRHRGGDQHRRQASVDPDAGLRLRGSHRAVLITFRSWRATVVAVVPLVITSILCEALMVMLGIGVKVATLPVVALGVGIGVDYALYLLSVQLAQQRLADLGRGLQAHAAFTGKVVVLVGVTLAAGVITWACRRSSSRPTWASCWPSCSSGTWSARWC